MFQPFGSMLFVFENCNFFETGNQCLIDVMKRIKCLGDTNSHQERKIKEVSFRTTSTYKLPSAAEKPKVTTKLLKKPNKRPPTNKVQTENSLTIHELKFRVKPISLYSFHFNKETFEFEIPIKQFLKTTF